MSQTIYRKYRPQSFEELVGQNHIRITLQNEIKSGRIAHAFLFTGPRGVGKTTTARLLAKAVNCLEMKNSEPCNQCQACQEIIKGRALDILEIDAASHTQVDHVRENIIPNARTSPTSLKYKIFIIDEVHMLSISAFNALLKILEEPPAHVIFILATTEVHKLPETIISRCQRFDFKRVSASDIKKRLQVICEKEKIEVEDKVLASISLMAEGSIRDAESTLGQIFSLGEKKITYEVAELVLPRSDFKLIFSLFKNLIKKNSKESIEIVNNLVNEGINIKYFTDQFIEFLRKAILIKIDDSLEIFSYFEVDKEYKKEFNELLSHTDLFYLKKMIDIFIKYRREIDLVQIPQLPLEILIVEMCGYDEVNDDFISSEPAKKSKKGSKVESKQTTPKKEQKSPKIESKHSDIMKNSVEKWSEVVKNVNINNHSLALVLKSCLPVSFEKNHLIIGCKFSFHQEKLSEIKNIGIIEEIVKKIIDQNIKIKFRIENINFPNSSEKKESKNDKDMTELLESFSGESVDI